MFIYHIFDKNQTFILMSNLVHKLIFKSADQTPDSDALIYQGSRKDYAALAREVENVASNLLSLGFQPE